MKASKPLCKKHFQVLSDVLPKHPKMIGSVKAKVKSSEKLTKRKSMEMLERSRRAGTALRNKFKVRFAFVFDVLAHKLLHSSLTLFYAQSTNEKEMKEIGKQHKHRKATCMKATSG